MSIPAHRLRAPDESPTNAPDAFPRSLAVLVALAVLVLFPGQTCAQSAAPRPPPEKVDPYTRGTTAGLDKADYMSLGPFALTAGIKSTDVEETIGGAPMVWVETDHFRIGSTLAAYTSQGDSRESRRLKEEFAALKSRFDRFQPTGNKLDPWLRLHLTAWRLERLYDDFLSRFGLLDEEFDPARRSAPPPSLGGGRYLGMEHKFVVLLFEDDSSLARFGRRYFQVEDRIRGRWRLPGGALAMALTAEGVRSMGFELDAALSTLVLGDAAQMLLEGLNENISAIPQWLLYGIGHHYARELDPRWALTANGTLREFGDDSWKWEERVGRIVANDAGIGWSEMQTWKTLDDISAQGHMLAWSRTDWLLNRRPGELRAFLLAIAQPLPAEPETELRALVDERVRTGVKTAFGATLDQIDLQWRAWVKKKYPK